MHASMTSCFNAGLALVGAGVIAVSPIAIPDDPPPIREQAVQLVADPITFYTQVFEKATANGGQLLQRQSATV